MRTFFLCAMALASAAALRAACPAPPEPGWCEAAERGPDMIPGTMDDRPGCIAGATSGTGTACGVHSAATWRLQQDTDCSDCVHEWYFQVGCHSTLELVVRGADALTMSVTDVDTGATVGLSARNECSDRADTNPFHYCQDCGFQDRILAKDLEDAASGKPAGSCTATIPFTRVLPEDPCWQWTDSGPSVTWGPPTDSDGDGFMDADFGFVTAVDGPACTPCPASTCACGHTHDNNRAFSQQDVRICLTPPPGIYRLRTVGGGRDWTIDTGGMQLHDTCALAAADLSSASPLPQLRYYYPLAGVWHASDTSGCPASATVDIFVCNVGNAPADSVPLSIVGTSAVFDVDLAAHPTDPACQVPLPAGECRECRFDVPAIAGTLRIDHHGTLLECSDATGGRICTSEPRRDFPFDPCGGAACSATAALSAPSSACGGAPVLLDASASTVGPCGGASEWRFLADGVLVPGCDWSGSATCAWTASGVDLRTVTAEVRCSSDAACADAASAVVLVQPPPTFGSVLVATPGSCSVHLEWSPASGSVTYDVYRADVPPVPLDAAHRIASGLTATSFLDASLTGTAAWRVEAVSSCGRVPNGGGDVVAGPLPLAFDSTIAAANEGDCAVRVTWGPADPAAGVTYDLYRSDVAPVTLDAAHLVQSGLTAASFLDAPPWGTPVQYRVEAVDACHRIANAGGDSAPVTPLDATAPAFAGIVNTRDLGFCEVEVTWSAASDACSGVAGYNVYRDHGVAHAGETLVASMVPSSPHVDTTPGNGTWVYVVRAVDAAGNEDPNEVFQQESEGSCRNDFPRDAGLDREDGIDSPNADGGHLRLRRGFHGGLWIRWKPSPDEGGLYPVTYAVLRGSLTALRVDGYTHQPVAPDACGLTAHEYEMPGQADGQASYYLVAAVSGDNVTYGYDSTGARLSGELCR